MLACTPNCGFHYICYLIIIEGTESISDSVGFSTQVWCPEKLLQGVHLLEKCWKSAGKVLEKCWKSAGKVLEKCWKNWEKGLFLKTCWKNWNLIAFSPYLAGIAGKISFFIPFLFFQCYVFMLF